MYDRWINSSSIALALVGLMVALLVLWRLIIRYGLLAKELAKTRDMLSMLNGSEISAPGPSTCRLAN